MTELMKISYAAYLLLDKKVEVTTEMWPCREDPGKTGTGWDAFLEVSAVAGTGLHFPQLELLTREAGQTGRSGEPGPSEPAMKKCSSVSRLSSCSPKRVLAAGRRQGKAWKGHTGGGGRLGRRWQSSRNQEVVGENSKPPRARDASVEQLLCQSSLGEGSRPSRGF